MEEETGVQRTVETTGRSGVKASGTPPVADRVEVEPAVEESPAQPEQETTPAVAEEVAPIATGALSIPALDGWSEQVVEEVPFVEGGELRPVGRGLAVVTGIPAPWSAGTLYVVHSGGAPESPGNALSMRDGGSTTPVGTQVVLPDGSPAVVTYSEVSPKASLPTELWQALESGHSVLVSCRPEEGAGSSSSNIVTLLSRTA